MKYARDEETPPQNMLRSRLVQVCLLLLLAAASSHAQTRFGQWVHTAWNDRQGAPSSVRGLAKSPDGYLWVASAEGLFRFDGTSFERMRFSGSQGEAAGSVVNVLFASKDGDIWMATPEAVGIIHENQIHLMASQAQYTPTHVHNFAEDKRGSIWAAAGNGLFCWSSNAWHLIGEEAGLPARGFNSVFVEQDGSILASSDTHLFERKNETIRFTQVSAHIVTVNHMQQDSAGRIWLADTSGTGVYPLASGAVDPKNDSRVRIGSYRILFDSQGELWITSLGDGLRRIEHPEKPFGVLDSKSQDMSSFTATEGLTDNYMQTILQDDDGAVWIGTRHGLDCFRKSPVSVAPIKITNWKMSLSVGTSGDLWIAENANLTHAVFEDGKIKTRLVYSSQNWDKPRPVLSVPVCDDMDYGTLCADGSKAVVYRHPEGVPSTDVGSRVCVDRALRVWLAKDGYGVYSRDGDRWSSVPVDGERINKPVSAAQVGSSGTVWFAFGSRLMQVLGGALHDVPFTEQLNVGSINAIEDRGDHVWLGGIRGIALVGSGRVAKIRTTDADALTDIIGVQETGDGGLWITKEHEVLHIDGHDIRHALSDPNFKVEHRTLGVREGFPGRDRYQERLASDGSLWLVSQESILRVDTKGIITSYKTPVTSVREMEANGQSILPGDRVQLPPHTSNVKFRFVGINLPDPVHVSYRYRLMGVDKDWQNNGVERAAMYTNLSPGEYEFHVVSRNNAGDWSPDTTTVRFIIQPAWYQRLSVEVGAAVMLVLISWAFFHNRVKQAEVAMAKAFDERLDERTRMARELHDTFLQTVQGSKMVADDALDAASDQLRMRHALERLSLWLGQAVTEGRAALHALRVSTTEQNHLAGFLERTAQEHAQKSSISVSLTVIGDARDLHPFVRDEIARIAEEAIRNVCLHSKGSQLSIELCYARDLYLRIRDNGIGIDPDVIGAGKSGHFGIVGMKERSARIRAKIKITSTVNTGTEVTVNVPGEVVYRRQKQTLLATLRFLVPWRNNSAQREIKVKEGKYADR